MAARGELGSFVGTRLFLDSEWNNEAARELVSIALVSENGAHEFYAERDPLPGAPSRFVREEVYRLLERGPAALPDTALSQALEKFMAQLGARSSPTLRSISPCWRRLYGSLHRRTPRPTRII